MVTVVVASAAGAVTGVVASVATMGAPVVVGGLVLAAGTTIANAQEKNKPTQKQNRYLGS